MDFGSLYFDICFGSRCPCQHLCICICTVCAGFNCCFSSMDAINVQGITGNWQAPDGFVLKTRGVFLEVQRRVDGEKRCHSSPPLLQHFAYEEQVPEPCRSHGSHECWSHTVKGDTICRCLKGPCEVYSRKNGSCKHGAECNFCHVHRFQRSPPSKHSRKKGLPHT